MLITAGLLSSTVHLGRPERAWRAFSQWRTSWLSREGVAALATYIPAGLFGIGWVLLGRTDGLVRPVRRARRSPRRRHRLLHRDDLRLAEAGPPVAQRPCRACLPGARPDDRRPVLNALLQLWGQPSVVVAALAAAAIPLAAWLKERFWRFVDTTSARPTPASAIGLPGGTVRALDFPHTGENYLLREMGFAIARKHAIKLRRATLGAGFVIPLLLTLAAALLPTPLAAPAAFLALASAMAGVILERWLFFAEAKHSVMLYYGALEA